MPPRWLCVNIFLSRVVQPFAGNAGRRCLHRPAPGRLRPWYAPPRPHAGSTSRRGSCHMRNVNPMTPAEMSHRRRRTLRSPDQYASFGVRVCRERSVRRRICRLLPPVIPARQRIQLTRAEVHSCADDGRAVRPSSMGQSMAMTITAIRSGPAPGTTAATSGVGTAWLSRGPGLWSCGRDIVKTFALAAPHPTAFGFSGSGLEWVVQRVRPGVGGLLLLGRPGSVTQLARRRMFAGGAADVLGRNPWVGSGLATSQAWLPGGPGRSGRPAARSSLPTEGGLGALDFRDGSVPRAGPARNRAMGVVLTG